MDMDSFYVAYTLLDMIRHLFLALPPAVRISSSLLEVRMLERVEAAGRSPTRELLWSWAMQNSKVQDLLEVLQDMGHQRALQLFQSQAKGQLQTNNGESRLQQV